MLVRAEVEIGWVEAIGRGEESYVKGYVGDFVGGMLKEIRCHFDIGVLKWSGDNDSVEWFFINMGNAGSICSNGFDIVLLLISNLGNLGDGVV